jgi:hypothetical protein
MPLYPLAVGTLELDAAMTESPAVLIAPPSSAANASSAANLRPPTGNPVTTTIQVLGKFVEALGRSNIVPPNRK